MAIDLHSSWLAHLAAEFERDYMRELKQFLVAEKSAGKVIYPPGAEMFNAFNSTPLEAVKVVILGQDPYHGPGQAHGLCFSVQPGVAPPPSLQNIFKELNRDLGIALPGHGYLQSWASQGVLLLNSVLSVERSRAGSHRGRGWEQFTDTAIALVSRECAAVVFMLWGSFAQGKAGLIDADKHLVLRAPHPSPLSAHRGFFNCAHFSAANAWLEERGIAPPQWSLPPQ